jgi:hypothetical protein
MKDLFKNPESSYPDLPTPISSRGGYSNASGTFPTSRRLQRKPKSREDLSQPSGKTEPKKSYESTNSTDRYFGSFSIESKRHVWDLLKKHPEFGDEPSLRLNRIRNNTPEVLPNDPIKTPTNGGFTVYTTPRTNESNLSGPVHLSKRSSK